MGRWRFLDATNPSEGAEHDRVVSLIESWWREFSRRERDIGALFSEEKSWDLPEWMERHLQALDPRLMWEFGPALGTDGHRLVITPEHVSELRPLVAELLARAPSLPGWEFHAYRPAESMEVARELVRARTQGDLSDVRVCVSRGEHNSIDLTYFCPKAKEPDDERALRDVWVATEALLGEKVLDRWIGRIRAVPLPPARRALSRWFGAAPAPEAAPSSDLSEMGRLVERLMAEVRAGLAPAPHCLWPAEDAEWTLLELKPQRADDYPEQLDLFVAKAMHLSLWQAAHSQSSFHDERFSRVGETFVFVKLDGSEGLEEERFADKSEIEDALDAALMPSGLGCQIGGGTGLKYSYIDLALTDVERGIDVVRERLRAGNVPRRSWIQFFDADLKDEWVGVYPDSPAPPMF